MLRVLIGAKCLVNESLHGVYDNAGDGDIEPDGKCPTGEFFMSREAAGEGKKERNQNYRQGYDREEDV